MNTIMDYYIKVIEPKKVGLIGIEEGWDSGIARKLQSYGIITVDYLVDNMDINQFDVRGV